MSLASQHEVTRPLSRMNKKVATRCITVLPVWRLRRAASNNAVQRAPNFHRHIAVGDVARRHFRLRSRRECGKRIFNVMLQDGLRIVETIRADGGWAAARKLPKGVFA